MMRYARWIAEHAAGDVSGRCDPMTEAMAQAFPELARVYGLYVVPDAEHSCGIGGWSPPMGGSWTRPAPGSPRATASRLAAGRRSALRATTRSWRGPRPRLAALCDRLREGGVLICHLAVRGDCVRYLCEKRGRRTRGLRMEPLTEAAR